MKSLLFPALVGGCFALSLSLAPLLAQENIRGEAAQPAPPAGPASPAAASSGAKDLEVDLLAGAADRRLEVKFIPRSDREARLLVKNVSDRPLSVRLPDALAARPVLAQARFGVTRPNRRQPNNTPQAMGAGMPAMNGQNRFNGPGGAQFNGNNLFNIAPEHVVELKVDTVCLEHGKKDPRPQIAYEICPLVEVTKAPGVEEILKQLGAGSLDQRASQAAAWHLACGLSWEDLAAKRIEHLNGPSELYFTEEQLRLAQAAAEKAEQAGEQARDPAGESGPRPRGASQKSVAESSIP